MAHKEPSRLDFHCLQMYVRIYLMSKVNRLYQKQMFKLMDKKLVTILRPIFSLSRYMIKAFFKHAVPLSSEAKFLKFGLSLCLPLYFLNVSSESSSETRVRTGLKIT